MEDGTVDVSVIELVDDVILDVDGVVVGLLDGVAVDGLSDDAEGNVELDVALLSVSDVIGCLVVLLISFSDEFDSVVPIELDESDSFLQLVTR